MYCYIKKIKKIYVYNKIKPTIPLKCKNVKEL